jgi:hypothetical protein
MDFGPKFTGDDPTEYIAEERFIDKVQHLKRSDMILIFRQISEVMDALPNNSDESQTISGVIGKSNPMFFTIEYFKESDVTILIDFNETDSDGYLDAILEGNSLGAGGGAPEPTEDR